MLTNIQIETAKSEELERLAGHIASELERRRAGEEVGETAGSVGKEVLESHDTPRGTYQWERVRCGHPERCKKCQSGEKHGPYLYRYFYKDGRRTSEYVRLKDAERLGYFRPMPK